MEFEPIIVSTYSRDKGHMMRKIPQYLQWILLGAIVSPSTGFAVCSTCGIAASGTSVPMSPTEAVTAAPPGTIAPAVSSYEAAARPITTDYAVQCPPCGFVRALPGPGYDYHGVLPYEAYVATTSGLCRSFLDGFYVGVDFGGGSVDLDLEVNGVKPVLIDSRDDKSYIFLRGDVGYAITVGRFYLALEGGYEYRSLLRPINFMTSASVTVENDLFAEDLFISFNTTTIPCNVHLDVNAQNVGTIDILPGFAFSPRAVVYGRLGVEVTQYKLVRRVCVPETEIIFQEFPPFVFDVNVNNTEFRSSFKENTDNFRAGIGFAFAPCPRISLSFDYVHVFGRTISVTPSDINAILANITTFEVVPPLADPVLETIVVPLVGDLAGPIRINTERNQFQAGISFHF